MKLKINRKISKVNRTLLTAKVNEYIVIHYVGGVSTAENNANYFYDENRNASAHFFVDEKEIWQIVETYNAAWHVGLDQKLIDKGLAKYYNGCRNYNSIGIEMCCKKDNNGNWYFEPETVDRTIELVKELMAQYHIPVERVVRHFDVTHKICPEPYVRDENAWKEFLSRLEEKPMFEEGEELQALDYLVEKKRIFEKQTQIEAINIVKNYKYVIIKWANDVKTLEKRGLL